MKEIAILGVTASGKSAMSIEIAKKYNANILSLDSLSIYKEIDIASAKPTIQEREEIKHFGIDIININDYFSAATFFDIYKKAKRISKNEGKNLIITGGTSFYLKSMIEGLSPKINISDQTNKKVLETLGDLEQAYRYIKKADSLYFNKISQNDSYRIQKWYEIYYETGLTVSLFFEQNKKTPIIKNIPIFEILIDKTTLKERIKKRTENMLNRGLVDEVFNLEKKYTRLPNPMKAIGIKETLDYLDAKINLKTLNEQINTHTLQLAKRQSTFNTSQFPQKIKLLKDDLIKYIGNYFNQNINSGKIKL